MNRLISVHSQLVREHLVAAVHAAARERCQDEFDETLASAAQSALEHVRSAGPAPGSGTAAAEIPGQIARMGYAARVAEAEMFEPARRPAAWLADLLRERMGAQDGRWLKAAIEISRELARTEPAQRPDPDSKAPTWRVPGPGGHVRHYVALEAIAEASDGTAGSASDGEALPTEDWKRCWVFGFLLRCCEETRERAEA